MEGCDYMINNKGVFTCSCGCGSSVIVNYIDKTAYLDFLSSDFFTKQGLLTNLRETAVLALKAATSSKSTVLKDIIVDEEELKRLKEALQKLELKDEKHKNYSKLRITFDKDIGFSILLQSNLSLIEVLQQRRHRAYEFSVGKKERAEIIRQINRALTFSKHSMKG